MNKESFKVEYKESYTKTFLKTVSAYANYNDGEILFGINDSGEVVGINVSEEDRLRLENMINDSLEPVPEYKMEVRTIEGKSVLALTVYKGKYPPYFYKNKAYRRTDTSTVAVDREGLKRLVLEGLSLDYEETKSIKQDLEFSILENKLKTEINIYELSMDILKTLKLVDKSEVYNVAGALLSDSSGEGFPGIDIVKFGKNISKILNREILNGVSVLKQYDEAVKTFERYYQYEEIEGYKRIKKEIVPYEAFRKALANAIIHREWNLKANIQISMYDDEIVIVSPGGLMDGVTEDDYLRGNLSVLRNPILADVFFKLNLIEKFGTGIKRIIEEYYDSVAKPKFEIGEYTIKITLPRIRKDIGYLSEDESLIYKLLEDEINLSRYELDEKSGFNKAKTVRTVNKLLKKNIIKKHGKGPSTTYRLNRD